jgi:hypothetical protein
MLRSSVRVILCAYVETTVYEDARQESRSKIMSRGDLGHFRLLIQKGSMVRPTNDQKPGGTMPC